MWLYNVCIYNILQFLCTFFYIELQPQQLLHTLEISLFLLADSTSGLQCKQKKGRECPSTRKLELMGCHDKHQEVRTFAIRFFCQQRSPIPLWVTVRRYPCCMGDGRNNSISIRTCNSTFPSFCTWTFHILSSHCSCLYIKCLSMEQQRASCLPRACTVTQLFPSMQEHVGPGERGEDLPQMMNP